MSSYTEIITLLKNAIQTAETGTIYETRRSIKNRARAEQLFGITLESGKTELRGGYFMRQAANPSGEIAHIAGHVTHYQLEYPVALRLFRPFVDGEGQWDESSEYKMNELWESIVDTLVSEATQLAFEQSGFSIDLPPRATFSHGMAADLDMGVTIIDALFTVREQANI